MHNHRRRTVTGYLYGVGSLLAVELVAVALLLWPGTGPLPGTAHAMASQATPAQPGPATPARPDTSGRAAPAPAGETSAPGRSAGSTAPTPKKTAPEGTASGQRPNTIRLPAGGTATLVHKDVVGPQATLPIPESLGEATWWGAGLAAVSGSSVFAGHVNWGGQTGPFAELWDTRVDQRVSVTDAGGQVWNYRVSQVITLHKDELPRRADELFSQAGRHRIVLVTCGGRWVGGAEGYAENRVVIADPA